MKIVEISLGEEPCSGSVSSTVLKTSRLWRHSRLSLTVILNLTTDYYGSETTWALTNSEGTELANGGPYDSNTSYSEVFDLSIGTGYTFTIYDSYDDGIESPGGYSFEDAEGTVIVSGGASIPTTGESMTFDINNNLSLLITGTPATSIKEHKAYSFTPMTYSSDGSPLTFSITNRPAWANFDTNIGELTGTPLTSEIGTTSDIEISVSDGSATATLGKHPTDHHRYT